MKVEEKNKTQQDVNSQPLLTLYVSSDLKVWLDSSVGGRCTQSEVTSFNPAQVSYLLALSHLQIKYQCKIDNKL